MTKALIISDNLKTAYIIDLKLATAKWSNENISVTAMMERNGESSSRYNCIILVIGPDLQIRLSGEIDKMRGIVAGLSEKAQLYLIFEDQYDPIFFKLIQLSSQFFTLKKEPAALPKALDIIIKMETGSLSTKNYFSPMESF